MADDPASGSGEGTVTPSTGRMTPWRYRYLQGHRRGAGSAEGDDAADDDVPKPYAHKREPQEVEQVNVAVQVDPDEDSTELCVAAINQVRGDLLTMDQRMLWDLFCEYDCDGGMSGKLDRYELTGLLSAVDPGAGAREVAQWIKELDTPAPGEAQGDGEVSFVELLDWWDRCTTEKPAKEDGADAAGDPRLPAVREEVQRRARQAVIDEYTSVDGWANPIAQRRVSAMTPGELAVSVDGLLDTIIQVRFWLESRLVKEAELHERLLYNEARKQEFAGLSADEHEKFGMIFRRYVSELPNSKFAAEEAAPSPAPDAAPELSEKAQEKIQAMRAMVEDGDMTEEEFEAKRDSITQKAMQTQRQATAGPAPTIHVGEELRGLCALLGIQLTYRQWELIEEGTKSGGQGVYQPRMDLHSFLCFVAVRLGRVSAP